MSLTPGARVGPYEVLASLGAGGMAEVYRVRDPRLQREVALKIVVESLSADASFLARLEQEARLAGSLNHPNIVAVHDFGLHEGSPYVVTELLQGETLRQRLARGRVPLSLALDWTTQIAHGLDAAHEHGIVHRDLKPENVFLTRAGNVKLLDFGIAKAVAVVSDARGLLEPTLSPAGYATRTGAVLGTPGYMSPEQVRGEPVDARSDIFSLGAILYELLGGQRAFPGASVVERGHAILHTDPVSLPESVPSSVAKIVSRCLAKDPEQRFQSARDLGFAIEVVQSPSGSVPTSSSPGPRTPWRIGLFALAVLLALGGGFLLGHARSSPDLPDVRALTFQRGSIHSARFAPDGRTVHFTAAWNGGVPQLYSTTIDSPEARALGFPGALLLAVSPSGELALSLRAKFEWLDGARGTLAVVPAMGGAPRELATDVEYADWAPDGQRLAVVRVQGDRSRLEFPLGRVAFESTGWVSHPRVAPTGDRVAFVDHGLARDAQGTVRVTALSGVNEEWSPRFETVLGIAWMPDGRQLLASGGFGSSANSLWALRPGQPPRLLYRAFQQLILTDVSPEGRILVIDSDWRREIEARMPDGATRSLEWLDWGVLGGLSDDGNSILMGEYWPKGSEGGWVLMLRDLREAAPAKLGSSRPLALSPDGRWAVTDEQNDPRKLVLLPTGVGESRPLRGPELGRVDGATFFRDGKRLALVGRQELLKPSRVFVFDIEKNSVRPISPEGVDSAFLGAAVSFDERRVAVSGPDGVITAYGLEGEEPIRVPAWGENYGVVGWLQGGSLLAFQRYEIPSHVERFDPRTQTVTPFGMLAPHDGNGVTRILTARVTPDGKTFAFDHMRMSGALHVLQWKSLPSP